MSDEQNDADVAPDKYPTPETLGEAMDLVELDLEEMEEVLAEAHKALWSNEPQHERRLEFAFRAFSHGADSYNHAGERWMQYHCELTGMRAALPRHAPTPQVLIFDKDPHGGWTLMETLKVHPDFLKDRGRLYEMLVAELETRVRDGIYQARKALDALRFLSETDEVEGLPSEGVSFPRDEGYEALGNRRPVAPEDEDE